MTPSPFTALIDGRDRRGFLCESPFFIAILESRPLVLGHVVIVSKKEIDHLFELETDALSSLLTFAQPIARAIEAVVSCRKIGIAVIGLETRHAHLHLVPLQTADDLNFTRAKLAPADSILADLTAQIRAKLMAKDKA